MARPARAIAGIAFLVVLSRIARGDSLGVSAEVGTGPVFVGQAAEIRVRVAGAGADLAIDPPEMDAAAIYSRGPADPASQGDGSPTSRLFVVVPRRAGPLAIPPFRVRSGDRSASSRGLRLTVSGVPTAGRTSAFLGGVGTLEVQGEVEPARVRLGQALECRVRVSGEAAWGSSRGPDLSAWAKANGIRVEPLPDAEVDAGPPSRTFRYRLRPTRAGKATLPPIAIAAFDPSTRRFTTKATSSIPIEVDEPARFDPGTLRYGEDRGRAGVNSRPRVLPIAMAAMGVSILASAALAWRRRVVRTRARRMAGARAWARSLAGRLDPSGGEVDVARQITAGFAELLFRALDRPQGVLTPPETSAAVAKLTRDETLAGRAGRLIGACDRAVYGGGGSGSANLAAEAREVLGAIEGKLPGRAGGGKRAEGGSRDRIV